MISIVTLAKAPHHSARTLFCERSNDDKVGVDDDVTKFYYEPKYRKIVRDEKNNIQHTRLTSSSRKKECRFVWQFSQVLLFLTDLFLICSNRFNRLEISSRRSCEADRNKNLFSRFRIKLLRESLRKDLPSVQNLWKLCNIFSPSM